MGEFTNFKINGYELSCTDTNVTIHTRDGFQTVSVDDLRHKVNDPYLHIALVKMYRAMLKYYEESRKV